MWRLCVLNSSIIESDLLLKSLSCCREVIAGDLIAVFRVSPITIEVDSPLRHFCRGFQSGDPSRTRWPMITVSWTR